LLEDGMDIITLKDLWATKPWNYVGIFANSPARESTKFSPLDTLLRNAAPSSRCTEKAWKRIETIGLNTWQLRTLSAIKRCRTAELGIAYDCDECGKLTISYNFVAIGIALNVRGINDWFRLEWLNFCLCHTSM
jgi:hypothetical protein